MAYDIVGGNSAQCCTSKADCICCLLQHVPAAPPSSSVQEKMTTIGDTGPIILPNNARSHTAVAVPDLLCRWQCEIQERSIYSPNISLCDYDLFTKVKEPLRGTWYNTIDELICAIGRSIWSIQNIKKDGCADGVRCLPNIWQKVINKEATILNVHKCCTSVNKAMSEISNCCHYFLSNRRGWR